MATKAKPAAQPSATGLFGKVRSLCLSLPETSEAGSWGHPNFLAGKRTFVTFENIKGKDSIAFHLDPFTVEDLQRQPGFFLTPYGQGRWVSLLLTTRPKWAVVESLVLQSYRLVALKRMLTSLDKQSEK